MPQIDVIKKGGYIDMDVHKMPQNNPEKSSTYKGENRGLGLSKDNFQAQAQKCKVIGHDWRLDSGQFFCSRCKERR